MRLLKDGILFMAVENRKIKNATKLQYDGIDFKSKLEVNCYIALKNAGFQPQYENLKFVIQEAFYPSVPYYKEDRKSKGLKIQGSNILPITYTPDITFVINNTTILIELKGFCNDVYPLKQKIFRKWLETASEKYLFFEIKNMTQLKQMVELLKQKQNGN